MHPGFEAFETAQGVGLQTEAAVEPPDSTPGRVFKGLGFKAWGFEGLGLLRV